MLDFILHVVCPHDSLLKRRVLCISGLASDKVLMIEKCISCDVDTHSIEAAVEAFYNMSSARPQQLSKTSLIH